MVFKQLLPGDYFSGFKACIALHQNHMAEQISVSFVMSICVDLFCDIFVPMDLFLESLLVTFSMNRIRESVFYFLFMWIYFPVRYISEVSRRLILANGQMTFPNLQTCHWMSQATKKDKIAILVFDNPSTLVRSPRIIHQE